MKPWLALIAVAAAPPLLAGAYLVGRGDGVAIERGKRAAAEKAVTADRAEREGLVDAIGGSASAQQTQRAQNVREIYRESHTITERPVYRNVCIDADGVRLLDRAAATANGADRGGGPAGASDNPVGDAQR